MVEDLPTGLADEIQKNKPFGLWKIAGSVEQFFLSRRCRGLEEDRRARK